MRVKETDTEGEKTFSCIPSITWKCCSFISVYKIAFLGGLLCPNPTQSRIQWHSHSLQNLSCLSSFLLHSSHSITGFEIRALWKAHLTLQPRCVSVPPVASAFTPAPLWPSPPRMVSQTQSAREPLTSGICKSAIPIHAIATHLRLLTHSFPLRLSFSSCQDLQGLKGFLFSPLSTSQT